MNAEKQSNLENTGCTILTLQMFSEHCGIFVCRFFFKALGSVITFPFRTKNKKEKLHIFGPYEI